MRRVLPLLALLLLIAGTALWLVARDAQPASAPAAREVAAMDPGTAPETVAPESAARRVHSRRTPAATDHADAAVEADAAGAPEVVLRVVTESDALAIVGLRVAVAGGNVATLTDPDGRATFALPEGLAALDVQVRAPGLAERIALPPGETVLRVPDPVPLEVRFVDAETGRPGPWPLSAPAGVHAGADGGWTRTVARPPLWPGAEHEVRIESPDVPEGWVAPRAVDLVRGGRLSRYADRAVATVPIPREARVVVRVHDTAGRPVEGANAWVSLPGFGSHRATTDALGEARIRGMAFHRGDRLRCGADRDGRAVDGWTASLASPDVDSVSDLVLPDRPSDSGGGFSGRSSSRWLGTSGDGRTSRAGTGALVVQVLRRDGRPAGAAHVDVSGPWYGGKETDAHGFVRFEALPGGAFRVTCSEHGLLPIAATVDLADGATEQVLLREPTGRRVQIRVVDADGLPVPCARVAISGPTRDPWVRLEHDTQFLDLHTDATGTLRVEGVVADATITATFGTRSGSAKSVQDDVLVTLAK